jgi:hypothetical protein
MTNEMLLIFIQMPDIAQPVVDVGRPSQHYAASFA